MSLTQNRREFLAAMFAAPIAAAAAIAPETFGPGPVALALPALWIWRNIELTQRRLYMLGYTTEELIEDDKVCQVFNRAVEEEISKAFSSLVG